MNIKNIIYNHRTIICISLFVIVCVLIYFYFSKSTNNKSENQTSTQQTEEYTDKYNEYASSEYPEDVGLYQSDVPYNWMYDYFDKIYIIYVPDRKANMDRFSKYINIKPTFFSAIMKDQLRHDKLISNNLLDGQSELNLGRIACHLSHMYVLQEFLKDTTAKTCMVFEDDIALPKDLKQTLMRIEGAMTNIPEDWQLLNFGRCWDRCSRQIPIPQTELVRSFRSLCRHSYAVTRKGAEIILKNTLPMTDKPGDSSIGKLTDEELLIGYAITPRVFWQNRVKFGSNIGNDHLFQRECSLSGNNKLQRAENKLLRQYRDSTDINFKIDMPVYVINLDKEIDRKSYMLEQFRKFNVNNARVIEAIDGNYIKDQNNDIINGVSFTSIYTPASMNELGRILSHYKAIQNMYNSGANYGLILEDDMSIALLPFVEESLDQIAKNAPKNWNVIILYNKNVLDKKYTDSSNVEKDVPCAYLLSKKGATNILKNMSTNNFVFNDTTINTPHFSMHNILYSFEDTYVYKFPIFFITNYYIENENLLENDHNQQREKESLEIIKYHS